jgi:hypothetical protein
MTEGKGRETTKWSALAEIFWGNRSTSLTANAVAVKSVTHGYFGGTPF